ncbi:MAG: host attachment protein [Bdellovibrionota bacterium]
MGKVLAPKGFDPKFERHWYLVANRVEAVLYAGRIGKDFHFLRRFSNPKGKLTELQLVADKPGRKFSSSRSGVRHGFEPRSLYHEQVAIQFARRIGKAIDRSLLDKEFSDLVVLAEPHFLGLLNKGFSQRVKAKVINEVPREWHEGSDRDLEKYLQKKLA